MRMPSEACTLLMLHAKLASSHPDGSHQHAPSFFEKAMTAACQKGRQGRSMLRSLRLPGQSSSAVRWRLSPS